MGFIDDVIIDGAKLDAEISSRILTARSIRTMKGAASIELGIVDDDYRLRESGVLTRRGKAPKGSEFQQAAWDRFGAVRLTINGRFYRFVDYSKQPGSDVLLLTWEDEIATLMRGKTGPRKASRGDMSRLDFVVQGARRVRSYRINVRAPEADEKQPIAGDNARSRAKVRERGLSKGARITVKGVKATKEQRRNLETILSVADEERAGELATIAMLCAAIGESSVIAQMNQAGSGYGGVFQGDVAAKYHYFEVDDTEEMAHYFLRGGKGFQQGGAIKLATDDPGISPGEIAYRVEGSVSNFESASAAEAFYGQWEQEARKILDAYGGPGRLVVDRKRYEYEVAGEDKGNRIEAETEWDASGRLLEEVRFNRFASENTLWLASDEWFFGREPVFYLEEDETTQIGVPGVGVGRRVDGLKVQALKPVWTGRPGAVGEVSDREGPIAGRWLTDQISEDLLVAGGIGMADLVLRRPQRKLKEPAAERSTRLLTESPVEAGSVRAAIVEMAEEALERKSQYRYAMVRPYPRSLFYNRTRPAPRTGAPIPVSEKLEIDCSSFVTLVYKAAGAPDPNGRGYDGQGYTGSLIANGRRTNDPQPGDLAFYGQPEQAGGNAHVNVYIGNGQSINMGPSAGVSKGNTRTGFRSDFVGFYTYDLEG